MKTFRHTAALPLSYTPSVLNYTSYFVLRSDLEDRLGFLKPWPSKTKQQNYK